VAARLTAKARAAGKVAVQERVHNSAVQVARLLEQHVHKESVRNTGDPKARPGMTNRTPVRDRLGALGESERFIVPM
jgi:hypothetical protein